MNLTDIIKLIQGETGVQRDGVFGPVSAANVLAALQARHMEASSNPAPAANAEQHEFDPHSEATIATLDPKAQPMFRRFLAKARAGMPVLLKSDPLLRKFPRCRLWRSR